MGSGTALPERIRVFREHSLAGPDWEEVRVPIKGARMGARFIALREHGVFYLSPELSRLAELNAAHAIACDIAINRRNRQLAMCAAEQKADASWSLVEEKGGRKLHARRLARQLGLDAPARLPVLRVMPGLVIVDYGNARTEGKEKENV